MLFKLNFILGYKQFSPAAWKRLWSFFILAFSISATSARANMLFNPIGSTRGEVTIGTTGYNINLAHLSTNARGNSEHYAFLATASGAEGNLLGGLAKDQLGTQYGASYNATILFSAAPYGIVLKTRWRFHTNGTDGPWQMSTMLIHDGAGLGPSSDDQGALDYIADPVDPVTGKFYLQETDLKIAAPLPIIWSRTYNSQNGTNNNIGYGWLPSLHSYLATSTNPDVWYLDDASGSVVAYERLGTTDTWTPSTSLNTNLRHHHGASSLVNSYIIRLPATSPTTYIWQSPDGNYRRYEVRSFPTSNFSRTRPYLVESGDANGNKHKYFFGETDGQNDYGLVNKIVTSNGAGITITYSTNRLIDRITANDGRYVEYSYENNDLKTVRRADGTTVAYTYGQFSGTNISNHLIRRVTQPDGRILENDYDAGRRVTAQRATVDPTRPGVLIPNAAFDYSSPARTVVTDAYGRKTSYEHANGLITAIREFGTASISNNLNALRTVLRDWYPSTDTSTGAYARALWRETDFRGLVTEYKYDTAGNIIETKTTGDLDGDSTTPPTETRIVSSLYNTLNLLEWSADSATDLTTDYFYEDIDYPRLATRMVVKHITSSQVLRTDQFNYTERAGTLPPTSPSTEPIPIFARGLLETRTVAIGTTDEAVTDYDYDATGFRTSEIRRSGTADPDVSLALAPTDRREIHTITDAANRVTTFTYDGLSRPLTKTVQDETGATIAVTKTTYNSHGEVTRLDGPRSGPEDWIETDYDQAGRPSEIRIWRVQAKADGSGVEAPPTPADKSVSRLYHDFFNNLALVIDPKGHATTHQYDSLGRLTHTRRFSAGSTAALIAQYQADQLAARAYDGSLPAGVTPLSVESFTYEPGGQIETHLDVLGGHTTTLYNSRGQPRKRTHPDGSTTEWRYHPDGRVAREILRDGSYRQFNYDDVTRTTTQTLKKSDGTVLATETRAYDRRGNLVTFVDAEGFTFATTFDDLDRLKTTVGPAATATSAQQTVTNTYDASGILTTTANALGEKKLVIRDAVGRITLEEIRDANEMPVRVTTTAYSLDHHSATLTRGTGGLALVSTIYTDPQGRPLLSRYDDGTYSRQTYDLVGFPAESRDPLGRITANTFDALGHLATQTLQDTHLTTFVHNPAGQLLERRMASPQGTLVDKTVYDSAGRITSRRLVNGASESRLYSYAYHPSTHPRWAGLPHTATDPRSVESTFAYDDFLRVESVTTDGPAATTDSSTTYIYDRRGLLTELLQSAPAVGPPTIVSRPRDAYGRVSSETLTLDSSTLGQFAQHWDSAGRRHRLLPSIPALAPSATLNFNFGHRADGVLTSVSAGGFSATFEHANTGLLTTRQNPWRVQMITDCDSLGRIKSLSSRLASVAAAFQTETQTWRDDGTLGTYAVTRSGPGAWTESRSYGYDDRARVTSEGFSTGPATGQAATLAATFDHGGTGLGVRTDWRVGTGAPAAWQASVPAAADINAFARVTGDLTNAEGKTIATDGVSLGADYVELWVNGSAKGRAAHPGWADSTGSWSANLRLDAGAQGLEVRAAHPSGAYTATATRAFTVSVPLASVASAHDAEGNVASRTFADGRVQMLTWDAFNRLVHVTELDAAQNGYEWSAVYDGFGRRVRTTHQRVIGGTATGAPRVIVSLYDPEHEFLELAVVVDGAPAWKVFGPDINGAYGGWNGTGGLEAVLTPDLESDASSYVVKAAVSDVFGNVVATVTGLGPVQRTEWLTTRVGGYGPLPNHRAEILTSSLRLAEASAWRTRRADPTGFYWLGARYYEPHSGRFLSPDPYGHGSDMSLYALANGDPVNGFDPDGRLAKKRAEGEITLADYIQLAGMIGWDGFADNLSERQQRDYGSTALTLLQMELAGDPRPGAWKTIENELPGLLPNWEERRMSLALAAGLGEMVGKSGAIQNASNAMLSLAGNLARAAGDIRIVGSAPPIPINNRGSITLGPTPSGTPQYPPGSYTTFRVDGAKGRVIHYETIIPQTNPRNPTPTQVLMRFDGQGPSHFNKATQTPVPTPHVHTSATPGGVRPPLPTELPKGY